MTTITEVIALGAAMRKAEVELAAYFTAAPVYFNTDGRDALVETRDRSVRAYARAQRERAARAAAVVKR